MLMKFKIDWKIKNFQDSPPKKGQLLCSPTFVIDSLHGSQWVLHLYPNGDSDGNGQYTALYLVRKSDDDFSEDILLHCQLSFATSKWMSIHWKNDKVSWQTTDHCFQRGGRCGSQTFLEREKLTLFLEQDTLTVRCELFCSYVDTNISGGCVAVSLIGIDKRSFEWIIDDFQELKVGDKKVMPIKSASKDAHPMIMTLSMSNEKNLMMNISPVDLKRVKRADCSLYTGESPNSIYCGGGEMWFNETKSEENWNFNLSLSMDDMLQKQTNNSLHLKCYLTFWLGIEFEKVEYTYYTSDPDLNNEFCCIM